jgi:hypothetical protein
MSVFDEVIVGYGPEQLHHIAVYQDAPGEAAVIETVTVRPVRVFERRPDGALEELFGQEMNAALAAFRADAERFNNGESGL